MVEDVEVGEGEGDDGVEESEELEVVVGFDVCKLERERGDRGENGERVGGESEGSEVGVVGEILKGRIVVGSKLSGMEVAA